MKVDVEFIVKLKGKKVPTFKKGWEKGEIARVIMTFSKVRKQDLGSPAFIMAIDDAADKVSKDYVEITHKILSK